jgi:hypothetical protein
VASPAAAANSAARSGRPAAAGSSSTRVTSSRAIACRETCSSAPASSSIRLRKRSASARAAASRRLSSSISEPMHGLLLWVPKASSMSSDQAIFVDQATDASLPLDAVLIKIDRFG